jgi:hypothetical protein
MKYYILSPWAETGGPEALHQLCSILNEIGEDAFIYYYGNDYSQIRRGEFVPKYSEYNLKSSDISNFSDLDKENNVVIIPEVFPIRLIENFQNSKVVFWRLSIFTHGQELNLPIFQKVYQGCQCDTQFRILKDSKLFDKNKYFMLSDYTNEGYIVNEKNLSKDRKNQVLYNPRKGLKHTQSIINFLSKKDIKFIPITGMSNNQIKSLISDSKIYIDFGDHPGKDRMPRECASGGCVIITGTQRCASNKKDVPIDTKFEYNENNDTYDYQKIAEFILEVLDNYEIYFEKQKQYRNIIRKEKKTFIEEVRNMISLLFENEL